MSTLYFATWGSIIGLSLMLVGGLVMWAYGGSRSTASTLAETGLESDATRRFHGRLSRWFFAYGSFIITLGLALLFWSATGFFGG